MTEVISVDPRPRAVASGDGQWHLAGARCRACRHAVAYRWPQCPACGGPLEPAWFGATGHVWSSTVVRIPVPGQTPPYSLAYVDLDDGPRVLAHVPGEPSEQAVPVETAVRLVEPSPDGDLCVEVQR